MAGGGKAITRRPRTMALPAAALTAGFAAAPDGPGRVRGRPVFHDLLRRLEDLDRREAIERVRDAKARAMARAVYRLYLAQGLEGVALALCAAAVTAEQQSRRREALRWEDDGGAIGPVKP